MNLWLDDYRLPPFGWTWAKTVDAAKEWLETGEVENASLDHDLGACKDCLNGLTPEQWLEQHAYESMPNCEHFGTGYNLVCWMEETDNWPKNKPQVHSLNPVGRRRMQTAIDREWERRQSEQRLGDEPI